MITRKGKTAWVLVVVAFFGILIHHVHEWLVAPVVAQKTTAEAAKPHYVPMSVQLNRNVTIQLTTATTRENPFIFYPKKTKVIVHPGQLTTVYFYVKNPSEQAQAFKAMPHVAPANLVRYFERTNGLGVKNFVIQPKQTIKLPITFSIDTHLPSNSNLLTLNYTLFPGKVVAKKVVQ